MKTKEELLKEAETIAWAIDEGLETYSCLYIESFYRKKEEEKQCPDFQKLSKRS